MTEREALQWLAHGAPDSPERGPAFGVLRRALDELAAYRAATDGQKLPIWLLWAAYPNAIEGRDDLLAVDTTEARARAHERATARTIDETDAAVVLTVERSVTNHLYGYDMRRGRPGRRGGD